MADNIYIELELFLDPPITDPAALKQHLEQEISKWNKQINANPKFKVRVGRARDFINKGLSNLDRQAEVARNERLRKLRDDIEAIRHIGAINEDDLKVLKRRHQAFLSEATIQTEAGGVSTKQQAPAFVPPTCPVSFKAEKAVSVADMQQIQTDLEIMAKEDKRKHDDLYDLLELSFSAPLSSLQEKAKEATERSRKMPKQDERADPLNRLSGKALNFFKDDAMRKEYDVALKRFPFDRLCREKLELWANKDVKDPLPWKIYQTSIRDTLDLGFSQSEAEWLVYDYFCNAKKRPHPIPEILETDPVSPVGTRTTPPTAFPTVPPLSKITDWFKNLPLPSGPFSTSQSRPTSTTSPGKSDSPIGPSIIQKLREAKAWFVESWNRSRERISTHHSSTQFDGIDPKRALKEFRELRKTYGRVQTLSIADLDVAFRHLDAMIGPLRESHPRFYDELAAMHKAVAERLAEMDYQEERFGRALRCYKSIIDHHTIVGSATARIQEIDDQRTKAFIRIEKYLACDDLIGCLPTVNELERKFEGDPETEDFLRNKIRPKLATVQLSTKQVQQLVDEKKWQTLDQLLDMQSPVKNDWLSELHKSVKKKMIQADEAVEQIRAAMSQKDMVKTRNMLAQFARFISDHPELGILRTEFDFLCNHSAKIDKELGALCEKKHWVRAENVLRRFLVEHPVKAIGLNYLVQTITAGVVRYQNMMRLVLLLVFGGIALYLLSTFLASPIEKIQYEFNPERFNPFNFLVSAAIGISVVYFGLGFLIQVLRLRSSSPDTIGIGKVIGIFMCIFVFAAAFASMPFLVEKINDVLSKEERRLEDDIFLRSVILCVFGGILCGMTCSFLSLLYGLILRCVEYQEKNWKFTIFLQSVALTVFLMAVSAPKAQEILGDKILDLCRPPLFVSAVWIFAWFAVYRDYRKERDASFGPGDLRAYFERYTLLVKLRDNDFGKPTLLTTDWYHSVQQDTLLHQQAETQRRQQAEALQQQQVGAKRQQQAEALRQQQVAAYAKTQNRIEPLGTSSPLPIQGGQTASPPVQKVPVPKKAPVPPPIQVPLPPNPPGQ